MACAVFLHVFAHPLVEHLPVFCEVHVDEVYHNDTSHVSQSQLSGQFVGSAEVHFQCVCFLPLFRTRTVSAVYVHHMQRFGMLYDKICAMFVVNGFPKTRFNLFGDVEVIKDWHLTRIEFYDVYLIWGDHRYIVPHFLENVFIVHIDVLVGWVEQVAQQRHSPTRFLEYQVRSLLRFLHLFDSFFPILG